MQDKAPYPSKQPYMLKDSSPNPKVPVGAASGTSLTILITWMFSNAGVELPTEVAIAMAGLLMAIAGYLCPGRIN